MAFSRTASIAQSTRDACCLELNSNHTSQNRQSHRNEIHSRVSCKRPALFICDWRNAHMWAGIQIVHRSIGSSILIDRTLFLDVIIALQWLAMATNRKFVNKLEENANREKMWRHIPTSSIRFSLVKLLIVLSVRSTKRRFNAINACKSQMLYEPSRTSLLANVYIEFSLIWASNLFTICWCSTWSKVDSLVKHIFQSISVFSRSILLVCVYFDWESFTRHSSFAKICFIRAIVARVQHKSIFKWCRANKVWTHATRCVWFILSAR